MRCRRRGRRAHLLRERVYSAGVDRLAEGADRQHRVQVDDRHQQLLDVELGANVALRRAAEGAQCMDAGRHGCGGLGLVSALRHERRENVILADAQHVAVREPVAGRAALGERFHVVVDVHPVGAHVLKVEVALAELHAGVMRRHVALRIGQHPVVVGRAADGATLHREDRAAALRQRTALFADDPQPEHGSPTQMSDPLCDSQQCVFRRAQQRPGRCPPDI